MRGTCYRAARSGHLEVLKYAHEQGCPFDLARLQRHAASKPLVQLWVEQLEGITQEPVRPDSSQN